MKRIGVLAVLGALGLVAAGGALCRIQGDAAALEPAAGAAPYVTAAPQTDPGPASAEDFELADRVRRALAGAPDFGAFEIDAYAVDGEVVLTGVAATRAAREKIGEAAATVPGVVGVVNRIVVEGG